MPKLRLANFDFNIGRARELVGLGQSLTGMTYGTVDAADLYRSALVQAVASLDSYVHGILLDYAVEIVMGRRPAGNGNVFGLHIGAVSDVLGASDPTSMEIRARTHLAERLSKDTFQRSDAISQGFAAVGIKKVWTLAFPKSAETEITALGLIVARRNQIVHSCDVDALNPGQVIELLDNDAIDATNRIDKIVRAIDGIL